LEGLPRTRSSSSCVSCSITSQFKADTWQRWGVELDAKGDVAIGIVTIDGVEAAHKTLTNPYRPGSVTLIVGMYYAPDGPAHVIAYDDVSVKILP
jgi:hypothetical protein